MTAIFNKFAVGLPTICIFLAVLTASVALVSCSQNDQLKIQNDFPFEVKVMPVPKDVANGQTLEIRITIQRSGTYTGTKYYLRYFQFEGKGSLRYYDQPPYQPNDLYPLQAEQFRLYYTSASEVSQSFDIWISDNFGNEKKLSFQFNSSN